MGRAMGWSWDWGILLIYNSLQGSDPVVVFMTFPLEDQNKSVPS